MGTGGIADTMAGTLRSVGAPIVAVGSRNDDAARTFAARWGIADTFDSHDAVAHHPSVDVVYVATTNDRHLPSVMACVEAGVPVLCEKPVALDLGQATTMLTAASTAGVFVMEAMWMRFLPHIELLDRLLAEGTIGDLNVIDANLSVFVPQDRGRRWLDRDLGGGSLLDLGVYPMSLVHHVVGPPVETRASARLADTGVDVAVSITSVHAGGTLGSIVCAFDSDTTDTAVLSGTEGRIVLHPRMHEAKRVTLERRGEVVEEFDTGFEGHGFRFEVAHVTECVRAGLVESPLRRHLDTLEVMAWMDDVRGTIGVEYAVGDVESRGGARRTEESGS